MEEREIMEVDVLFVGGGIANLAGALHLSNLIKQHNEKVAQSGEGKSLDEVIIAVLEKGAYIGAHAISGAVMDPVALKKLVPDYLEKGAPLEGEVSKETFCYLTEKGKYTIPEKLLSIYSPMNNHGNYVVSLSRLAEWLGQMLEEAGVDVFPGFPGTEVLYDGDRVIGVRTGDKGVGPDGTPKGNFEPGIDLQAKVTIFGEGSRGNLTKTLIKKFQLDKDRNPESYEVGVKEVWEVPDSKLKPGEVVHSLGYPLDSATFGGGFIYGMNDNRIAVGLLTSLEYQDPGLDPHRQFQKFKMHPYVASLIKGGKLVQYGAKTAPIGGYFAVPKLVVDGGMIVGDGAQLFISNKIKGIHAAMTSGMLAAEATLEAMLADDYSAAKLQSYETALFDNQVGRDLYKSRNFHQAFQKGLWLGMAQISFQFLLGGKIIKERLWAEPDHTHLKSLKAYYGKANPSDADMGAVKYDGEYTFDKETDVYYSGTIHEEHQPAHLKVLDTNICYTRCKEEYGNPCVKFCPANVYEMNTDEETGVLKLKLNFTNCVHCKTCDVKDPYENITWVPPEGEGGPKYATM